jgi:uncharacterized protein with NRDE domain
MCLILLSFRAHRHFPLVVAANRDEHYSRPAAPAAFWDDHPEIYGGRDLEKGGTWMGLHSVGRFAAITNYREGKPGAAAPRSRGELVKGFLTGSDSAETYFRAAAAHNAAYNPYSMIAGDLDGLSFYSNRIPQAQSVAPGVHGLSNHLLDTPWPKVTAGSAALGATLYWDDPDAISAAMFSLLADNEPAAEAGLPDTGITRQRERELSPPFICGEHYGTRTSTVMLVHASGEVFFHEKLFGPNGTPAGENARAFRLHRAAPLTA